MDKTDPDRQPTSPDLQAQLSQLGAQLTAIQTQLGQLPELATKVAGIEESLMLVSDIYRYQPLKKYLEVGNFRQADTETVRVIQAILGRDDLEEIGPELVENFPCNALQTIDRLWRKYSRDRFGFSRQLETYQGVGGTLESTIAQDRDLVEAWGKELGWRENNAWVKCRDLPYTLEAPIGCHPAQWWNSPYGSKMTNFFLARLMACDV